MADGVRFSLAKVGGIVSLKQGGYRFVIFFECSCHMKYRDILGGTPTWDLDVPVHGTGANHAGWPSAPGT